MRLNEIDMSKILLDAGTKMKNSIRAFTKNGEDIDSRDRVGCVIMASGLGRRYGGNKLMEDLDGKPVIGYVLDATGVLFHERVVVTRHQSVYDYCVKRDVKCIMSDNSDRSDTVRIGLSALEDKVNYCFFFSGSQPLISKESVSNLLDMAKKETDMVTRACFGETAEAPLCFTKVMFDELKNLPEGNDGSYLAKKHPERVQNVPVFHEYELYDIATREDFEKVRFIKREILS